MLDFSEASVCSTKSELAIRPNYGIVGNKIEVTANLYPIKKFKNGNIFLYNINIIPEKNRNVNWKIFKYLEAEYKETVFDSSLLVYDGDKLVISPIELGFGDETTIDVDLDKNRPGKNVFKVVIKKNQTIDLGVLNTEFKNNNTNYHVPLMAVDLILKHKFSKDLKSIGDSFYFPENSFPMFGGIEAWNGIYHTCKLSSQKVLINVNNTASTFFSPITLDNYACKLFGLRNKNELPRSFKKNQYNQLLRNIKGLTVSTSHRGERSRKFKIEGLTQEGSNQTFFKMHETDENIDVATYFFNTYKLRLNNPTLPCIIAKKKTMIPLELCTISPGQRYSKDLNEKQRSDIIKFTCHNPPSRFDKINKAAAKLDFGGNEYLRAFDIEVSNKMETVSARVLNSPVISYDTNSRDGSFTPNMGVWNLRNKKFYNASNLKSWGVIFFGIKDSLGLFTIQKFVTELVKTCEETGISVELKTPLIEYINPMTNFENEMITFWKKTGNRSSARPQMLVCILSSTDSIIYSEIKRISETVLGVPTQCLQSKNTMNPKKQYCANVCLKINAKLGGINVCLLKDQIPFIYENEAIVFGATLAKSTNKRNPSIASVVSTLNPLSATYYSSYKIQESGFNHIVSLESMVKESLISFFKDCGIKPSTLLFYRDGISEGQFSNAMENEVMSIKLACKSLGETYNPSLTYIVSQKRHNVRFFPNNKNNADRSGNCMPGTVIDRTITHPLNFDFYLNSHSGIQGTSRSTHYFVLYDENELDSDTIQKITFNLCFTFVRCTRSVSIVPPLFYSNLLSKRTMCYSKTAAFSDIESQEGDSRSDSGSEVHKSIKDIMYYI